MNIFILTKTEKKLIKCDVKGVARSSSQVCGAFFSIFQLIVLVLQPESFLFYISVIKIIYTVIFLFFWGKFFLIQF